MGIVNEDSTGNSVKILEHIKDNPGCHLRQIKRELNLAMGTMQYHLNLLEKQGKISSEKQNIHKYYFPIGLFGKKEKSILKILTIPQTKTYDGIDKVISNPPNDRNAEKIKSFQLRWATDLHLIKNFSVKIKNFLLRIYLTNLTTLTYKATLVSSFSTIVN